MPTHVAAKLPQPWGAATMVSAKCGGEQLLDLLFIGGLPEGALDDLQDDLGSNATDDPHLPLLECTEELTEFVHGIISFAGETSR